MKNLSNSLKVIFFIVFMTVITGCSTQNMFQGKYVKAEAEEAKEYLLSNDYRHLIKEGDKVSVSVWNHEDLSVGSVFGIYNSNEVYGKWLMVNPQGEIDLPKIGTQKLGGLNTDEAKVMLTEKFSEYVKDPIIDVKILNREVSIVGEVKDPGNFLLEKDVNHLLEYLGKAGGPTFYADKTRIILMREIEGKPKSIRVDLTQMDRVTDGNLVLKDGDVIYVSTRGGIMIDKKLPNFIPITSVITTLAIVLSN